MCHEDADAIAFMDIQPVNNGHVLVVPREHYESLLEVPEELGLHLFRVTMRLANAVRKVTGCEDSEHRREQRRGSGPGRAALSRAHHSAARGRRVRHSAAVRRLADAGSHRARRVCRAESSPRFAIRCVDAHRRSAASAIRTSDTSDRCRCRRSRIAARTATRRRATTTPPTTAPDVELAYQRGAARRAPYEPNADTDDAV